MKSAYRPGVTSRIEKLEVVFVESGGDNLSATFSPELSDLPLGKSTAPEAHRPAP